MAYGRLWPVHPHPKPGELLSSWFVRVAEANAIKLQTLSWMMFGYGKSPWQRDIDRLPPAWFVDAVCEKTGLANDDAYRMTLDSYRARLYPRRRSSGPLPWVLPIISEGASRRGFGMQFCPACLAEDDVPYFRKSWRLALATYCPAHGCVLYDACPVCGAVVAYFRHDFGKEISLTKGIANCWACGADFRTAERKAAIFPTEELRTIFCDLLGSLDVPGAVTARFDLGFFAVLHQLCRIVGARQNQGKLLRYVVEQTGMSLIPSAPSRVFIEERRREIRHQSLLAGLWLMDSLDQRLQAAWQAKAVRYNLMIKDFHEPPGWYLSLVERFSDWRHGEV